VKYFSGYLVLIIVLGFIISLQTANAMWVKLSDTELVEKSDVIITAELTGQTQVDINQAKFVVGVLKVEEVLKGDKGQTVILLALPSAEGPRSSTDIFYKDGQKGLWFLREQKAESGTGIYLADQPQRFVSEKHAVAQIEIIRNILKDKKTDNIK
jgi:hypothetical protein